MSIRREEILDALRSAVSDDSALLHESYRHLSRPMTIAGLTLLQWTVAAIGVLGTCGLRGVLPLNAQNSLSVAGTVVGVPCTIVFFLISQAEFNARAILRAVWSWWRNRAVLLPGDPTGVLEGYQLTDPVTDPIHPGVDDSDDISLEDLWA